MSSRLIISKNVIPPPYCLIASATLFIVQVTPYLFFKVVIQQAQKQAALVDKIDSALQDLSVAISTVILGDDFPRCLAQGQVDEIRSAALFLTTSVMDCLSVIIKCVEQIGLCFEFLPCPICQAVIKFNHLVLSWWIDHCPPP
jgi:hypothetical protein